MRHPSRDARAWTVIFGLLAWGASPEILSAAGDQETFERYLLQRIEADPGHSDNWRLLGRIRREEGRTPQARAAYERALALDPNSAAAHFDLGELLLALGDRAAAVRHFGEVYRIAPESKYARTLRARGVPEPAAAGQPAGGAPLEDAFFESSAASPPEQVEDVQPAGYEIQVFDGSEELNRALDQFAADPPQSGKRFSLFLETGVLYNSNVTLTPISRELGAAEAASAQGFINPDLEWSAWQRGSWEAGPAFRGYFSLSEGNFRDFDLASFQPGVFIERKITQGDLVHIGRLEYGYSLNLLGGEQFGDRHSVTASLTTVLPDFDAVHAYLTASQTGFDGFVADPDANSLDGPGVILGVSRFFRTDITLVPQWSLGADANAVRTVGENFRYYGGNVHGDVTFAIAEDWELVTGGNVGFRRYPEYRFPGGRDTLTYRLSGRLRYWLLESWSLSLVANYDRFASESALFDAERLEGGMVTTWVY